MTGLVVAQADPITQRRDIMKGVGAATRTGGQLAKGDIPFDIAKAQEVLATYAKASAAMPGLFPETSKTGGQTTASPAVWDDKAAFDARFAAWGRESEAAAASVKDIAGFREAFGAATRSCGGCHTTFRVKT